MSGLPSRNYFFGNSNQNLHKVRSQSLLQFCLIFVLFAKYLVNDCRCFVAGDTDYVNLANFFVLLRPQWIVKATFSKYLDLSLEYITGDGMCHFYQKCNKTSLGKVLVTCNKSFCAMF